MARRCRRDERPRFSGPLTGPAAFSIAACAGRAVALIVQHRATAAAAGVEGDLSGHSLRARFATSAGIALLDSMRQTRHKSIAVASGYVRRASAWDRNAAAGVGL